MTGSARPVRLVLASASPARLATLRRAGLPADVVVSAVDEDALTAAAGPLPTGELTVLLAAAKARAVAARLGTGNDNDNGNGNDNGTGGGDRVLVLGCDSMLELDGESLGKPGTEEAAVRRWRQLRGRSGVLHTGHCLLDTASGREARAGVATTVRFADADDAEIAAYCASGEPLHVAGAFTVDGLGGWFVEAVDGDHHNVVGVSLPGVRSLLRELGYALTDLGYPSVD